MKDTIVEAVIEQLNNRSKIGINKYGVTLDRTDLSTLEWIQHAQEEAMDLCLYLEKIKQELKPTEKLELHTYHTDKNGCYNKKKEIMKKVIVFITDKNECEMFKEVCGEGFEEPVKRDLQRHLDAAKNNPAYYHFIDVPTAKIVVRKFD